MEDELAKMLTLPVIHAVGSGSADELAFTLGAPPSLPISAKRCAIITAGTAAAAPAEPAPAAPPAALAATEEPTDVATEVTTEVTTVTAAAVRADAASGPRSMAPRAEVPGLLTFKYSSTFSHSGMFEVTLRGTSRGKNGGQGGRGGDCGGRGGDCGGGGGDSGTALARVRCTSIVGGVDRETELTPSFTLTSVLNSGDATASVIMLAALTSASFTSTSTLSYSAKTSTTTVT